MNHLNDSYSARYSQVTLSELQILAFRSMNWLFTQPDYPQLLTCKNNCVV